MLDASLVSMTPEGAAEALSRRMRELGMTKQADGLIDSFKGYASRAGEAVKGYASRAGDAARGLWGGAPPAGEWFDRLRAHPEYYMPLAGAGLGAAAGFGSRALHEREDGEDPGYLNSTLAGALAGGAGGAGLHMLAKSLPGYFPQAVGGSPQAERPFKWQPDTPDAAKGVVADPYAAPHPLASAMAPVTGAVDAATGAIPGVGGMIPSASLLTSNPLTTYKTVQTLRAPANKVDPRMSADPGHLAKGIDQELALGNKSRFYDGEHGLEALKALRNDPDALRRAVSGPAREYTASIPQTSPEGRWVNQHTQEAWDPSLGGRVNPALHGQTAPPHNWQQAPHPKGQPGSSWVDTFDNSLHTSPDVTAPSNDFWRWDPEHVRAPAAPYERTFGDADIGDLAAQGFKGTAAAGKAEAAAKPGWFSRMMGSAEPELRRDAQGLQYSTADPHRFFGTRGKADAAKKWGTLPMWLLADQALRMGLNRAVAKPYYTWRYGDN